MHLKKIITALIVLLALSLPSCKRAEQGIIPGTLRFNLVNEPPSLDWNLATDSASSNVLTNIMEGLCEYDVDLNTRPALAESWDMLDGGRRWVFHLRKNARWTDGVPLTAQHFVDSWRRLVNPETGAKYVALAWVVKNAKEISEGKIKDVSRLGVRALDEHTLEVELIEPIVYFPAITTYVVMFPVRLDVIERHGRAWTEPENIVTLGPYKMTKWRHEYKIECVRNTLYHGKRPGLDRIVFYMIVELTTALTLYEGGYLDVVDEMSPLSIPAYEGKPDFHRYPWLAIYYMGFNTTIAPVDNPLLRRALASAIDRSKIPDILHGGQIPCSSLIPSGMFGHNSEIGNKFNPEKAREYLKAAGYSSGQEVPAITIYFNTLEGHKLVAQFVQQQWKKHLGIKVFLQNQEWKVYLDELNQGNLMLFRMGWIADYPDPDTFATIFLSDSANNYPRYVNPRYDELVALGKVEPDPEKRIEYYDESQRMLLEEASALIPLYTYTRNILVKPYVKGYHYNSMAVLYLRDTYISADGDDAK